jgi:hypothetical protein
MLPLRGKNRSRGGPGRAGGHRAQRLTGQELNSRNNTLALEVESHSRIVRLCSCVSGKQIYTPKPQEHSLGLMRWTEHQLADYLAKTGAPAGSRERPCWQPCCTERISC